MSWSSRARSTFPWSAGSRTCSPRSKPAIWWSVDGEEAIVLLRPGEDLQQAALARIRIRQGERQRYAALKDLPAETKDGVAHRI